jgi:hypothetical protein
MTGLEFRQLLMLGALAVVAVLVVPAAIVAALRRWTVCDSHYMRTAGILPSLILVACCAVALYGVYLYKFWDDSKHVAVLISFPLTFAGLATLHTLAVLGTARVIGLFLKPRERAVCSEMYVYLFAAIGLLWFDISKGANGFLVSWLRP